MNNQNKFIIISGATATGKTSTSIELAKHIKNHHNRDAQIINFDSLLFYKELEIGTAKPTTGEMDGVIHHLVNTSSITNPMNASLFRELAEKKVNTLFNQGVVPILVGGSAFYIRALIKGMFDAPQKTDQDEDEKKHLKDILLSLDKIRDYLQKNDPEVFNHIHPNDEYRLSRAVVFHITNKKKYSIELQETEKNKPYDFSINNQISGDMLHLYLEIEKEEHLQYILKRAKEMVENGLIDEVRDLLNKNFSPELKPLQSIGYKETIKFLSSDNTPSLDDLVNDIYISTRQLAKAQKTFFRKISPKHTICPITDRQNLFSLVDDFIK